MYVDCVYMHIMGPHIRFTYKNMLNNIESTSSVNMIERI